MWNFRPPRTSSPPGGGGVELKPENIPSWEGDYPEKVFRFVMSRKTTDTSYLKIDLIISPENPMRDLDANSLMYDGETLSVATPTGLGGGPTLEEVIHAIGTGVYTVDYEDSTADYPKEHIIRKRILHLWNLYSHTHWSSSDRKITTIFPGIDNSKENIKNLLNQ